MSDVRIIKTEGEHRQIAREMTFTGLLALHIDFNSIAKTARELGAHFEVRTEGDDIAITFFWSYTEAEALEHAREAFNESISKEYR